MKSLPLEGNGARSSLAWLQYLGFTLVLSVASSVFASAPAWWASYGVLDPSAEVDDFAVVNQGQLKTIVSKTAVYLDATLPGGAGADIRTLLENWNAAPAPGVSRDDYAAVNAGQLKTVVNKIYSRLRAAGRNLPNPWTTSIADDDYRIVNVGQVKTAFAFVVQGLDTDGDGYSDADEIAQGWDPLVNSGPVSQGGNGQASTPGMNPIYFPPPVLEGDSKRRDRWRYGYRGFQENSNRYLNRKWEWKLWSLVENRYIEGSCTWEMDPESGLVGPRQGDTPPDLSWLIVFWDVQSDTVRKEDNSDDPFRVGQPSQVTETLSSPNTRSGIESAVNGSIPPFAGVFLPWPWTIYDTARFSKDWQDDGSQDYLTDYYNVTRCQYRWKVQTGDPRTVTWVQRFAPATGPVEYKLMSWVPAGASISPVYTIDPLSDPRNGTYTIQQIMPDLDALTVRGSTHGYELDETREETVGAFVPINDDDDDYDSANMPDLQQSGATARSPGGFWVGSFWFGGTDTDLLPIVLRGGGVSTPPNSAYVLTIPDHVKVWANPDRTSLVGVGGSSATVYVPSGGDTKLYVEGITQKADYLTLSFSHGGTTVVVDKILITVFEWGGPLNVPGYSRHRYTAFGAPQGSQWIAPTSGRIMSRPTGDVNDVEILWESGPAVGLCNYRINNDYMWSREVNVVEFKIDFAGSTNSIVTRPLLTQQSPAPPQVIVSSSSPSSPAMEGSLTVTSVNGPSIAGQIRVAARFECGWIQSGKFTQAQARYSDGKAPAVVKVCSVQSATWHVDIAGTGLPQFATTPWYNQSNQGNRTGFRVVPRGGWTSAQFVKFTTEDTPTCEIPSFVQDLTKNVVTNAWIDDFEVDFAVRTLDSPSNYTVLARGWWRWDGSGRFNGVSWTSSGTRTTSRYPHQFAPITSGEQPRFTSWSPMNYLLDNRTWP